MTDPRPRPEYGEYATPEQQARAMGREYVVPGPTTDPAQTTNPAQTTDPAQTSGAAEVATPILGAGYPNRFFTVLLLAAGGFALVEGVPSYFNIRPAFVDMAKYLGRSSVPVPASLDGAGVWLLVANVVLYLASLLLSVWALRRGRRSAYIPILGFIVFALTSDLVIGIFAPGFLTQLSR